MYNYVLHDENEGKWLAKIQKGKAPKTTDDIDKLQVFEFKRRDCAESYCNAINDIWNTHYVVMFLKRKYE